MSEALPLAGKRILITRARHQAGLLSQFLEQQGAETIEIPAIEIQPPQSFHPLDTALQNLQRYRWVLVTSANGARALAQRLAALGLDASVLHGVPLAAIGSGTAEALRKEGFSVTLTPKEYVAESLLEALGPVEPATRFLIVRAEVARDLLPTQLQAGGAVVEIAEAYRTVVPTASASEIRRLFSERSSVQAATFTSSSTVSNFFQLLHAAAVELPAGLKAISIGPITSKTLREHGWEPATEADPHDLEGLVAATIHAFRT